MARKEREKIFGQLNRVARRVETEEAVDWSNRRKSLYKNYERETAPMKAGREELLQKLILPFAKRKSKQRVEVSDCSRNSAPRSKKKPKARLPELSTEYAIDKQRLKELLSPRGYVYRIRKPLFLRNGKCSVAHEKVKTTEPARGISATQRPHFPSQRLRSAYGPSSCYPTTSITAFVHAYWSTSVDKFGARTTIRSMANLRVVSENSYFREQIAKVHDVDESISFKQLLQTFFPLLKSYEIREIFTHFKSSFDDAHTCADEVEGQVHTREKDDLDNVLQVSIDANVGAC